MQTTWFDRLVDLARLMGEPPHFDAGTGIASATIGTRDPAYGPSIDSACFAWVMRNCPPADDRPAT